MPSNRITVNETATVTTFVTVNVEIRPPTLQVEDITRPGVDGKAFKRVAVQGGEFVVSGWIDLVDTSTMTVMVGTIKGFVGKLLTIDDSFGVSHTMIVCKALRSLVRSPAAVVVGGLNANPAFAITFELVCEDAKTS